MIKAVIFDLNGIFIQSPKLSDRFKDFNIDTALFLPETLGHYAKGQKAKRRTRF